MRPQVPMLTRGRFQVKKFVAPRNFRLLKCIKALLDQNKRLGTKDCQPLKVSHLVSFSSSTRSTCRIGAGGSDEEEGGEREGGGNKGRGMGGGGERAFEIRRASEGGGVHLIDGGRVKKRYKADELLLGTGQSEKR